MEGQLRSAGLKGQLHEYSASGCVRAPSVELSRLIRFAGLPSASSLTSSDMHIDSSLHDSVITSLITCLSPEALEVIGTV